MRLLTVAQAKEVDLLSQKVFDLSGEILMESAGGHAAREVDQAFYPELKRGHISIVCGPGNNGGDGMVMARHLHAMGHRDLDVFYFAPVEKQSDLFKKQLKRAELHGLKLINLSEKSEKKEQIRSSELIVDALFGVGLDRDLQGIYLDLVDIINSTKVPVVSLDCPSGLHCDRGIAMGNAVRATMTLSFGLAKIGFYVSDGPRHVGKLRVLPIGFPHEVLRGIATTHFGFHERLARRYLPSRSDQSNKSQHGHLVVIGGSPGLWGASLLCASAGYRMGVGYVTLTSFTDPASFIICELPEVLTGLVDDPAIWGKKITAVAIGPGLGVNKETARVIERLKDQHSNVVLDADALTTCVQFDLFPLPHNWVITPHSGELSRILKIASRDIDSDRYRFTLEASQKVGCHVLLKGFRSVLSVDNRSMVILSGNSALAKAGTGDVLTGMIAGLMAQGVPTLPATATAAYIHGRMADEWVRIGHDKRSLTASDLRDHLPQLMGRLAGGALV